MNQFLQFNFFFLIILYCGVVKNTSRLGFNEVNTLSYTVGVVNKSNGNMCSGVILSENLILTAAHCIEKKIIDSDIEVRFGSNLKNGYEAIGVDKIIIDSRFIGSKDEKQKGFDTSDLAIIVLKKFIPAQFSPIEIYSDQSELSQNTPLLFAGFGIGPKKVKLDAGIVRDGIVYLTNPKYSKTEFYIDQHNGLGACQGDSGGPLFVLIGHKLLLVGIASRGEKNCDFSIYIKSSEILKFYQEITAATFLDSSIDNTKFISRKGFITRITFLFANCVDNKSKTVDPKAYEISNYTANGFFFSSSSMYS